MLKQIHTSGKKGNYKNTVNGKIIKKYKNKKDAICFAIDDYEDYLGNYTKIDNNDFFVLHIIHKADGKIENTKCRYAYNLEYTEEDEDIIDEIKSLLYIDNNECLVDSYHFNHIVYKNFVIIHNGVYEKGVGFEKSKVNIDYIFEELLDEYKPYCNAAVWLVYILYMDSLSENVSIGLNKMKNYFKKDAKYYNAFIDLLFDNNENNNLDKNLFIQKLNKIFKNDTKTMRSFINKIYENKPEQYIKIIELDL